MVLSFGQLIKGVRPAFAISQAMLAALVVWLSPVLVGLADEPQSLQRFSRAEVHMGVEFEVVLYANSAARGEAALSRAMARIAALDKTLSDYDPESELSKLSESSVVLSSQRPASFPTVKLSDDLWTVLAVSHEISVASDGAFDVTLGPLTKLWRRARRWKELPDPNVLATARASVGYPFLKLDSQARTGQLLKPNMRLDLGGIAKGYAADEAVKTVVAAGISRVLVRASGDIAAADPPPGQEGWRIGVAPLNPDDPPKQFVALANRAISTSGDARQHLVVNGRRYSHIIDPRAGAGISGRSSVTVIAPRGIVADGVATAASVLGPDGALTLAGKFADTELLMVYEDETGQQRVVESPGFKRFETTRPCQ
jgi:thiamine biosynthesis lipoprotein